MTHLRVVSYNIRKSKGRRAIGVPLAELGAELGPRAADLLLCQEVVSSACGTTHQARALARQLDLRAAYGANMHYRRGNHGNATLARLPTTATTNHDLSTNRVERRGALYTRYELATTTLHVFNVHLGLTGGQRRRQVDRVAALLAADCPADEPVILGGDFNDWSGRLNRHVEQRCGLQNALATLPRAQRRTYPSTGPLFALDRLYIRGFAVRAAAVLRGAPWSSLSDHLPLALTLELAARS